MSDLASLEQTALAELKACADKPSLRSWYARYFGDQGEVKQALKRIGSIPKEDRPAYGLEVNRIKDVLTRAHEEKDSAVDAHELEASLQADPLDVTLPG